MSCIYSTKVYLTLDASSCIAVNVDQDCITNLDMATQVFAVAVKNGYDTGVKVERIESK
jgi:hypothetical protein